jgi:hypothetical protein
MNDPCKLIPVNYLKYRVSAFFNLNIDLTWSELTNASSDFMLSFNGSSVQSIIRIHSHSTLSSTMHKVMEREGRLWNGSPRPWLSFIIAIASNFRLWSALINDQRWRIFHHWTTHCENANIYIWHCIKIYIYLLVHVSAWNKVMSIQFSAFKLFFVED